MRSILTPDGNGKTGGREAFWATLCLVSAVAGIAIYLGDTDPRGRAALEVFSVAWPLVMLFGGAAYTTKAIGKWPSRNLPSPTPQIYGGPYTNPYQYTTSQAGDP